TWVTTLSMNALAASRELYSLPNRDKVRDWLTSQQYKERHPYTGAAPGGWAWTDLPGGVPDADDSAGAILALAHLEVKPHDDSFFAAWHGMEWLRGIQNRDCGIPTFCRGWGNLPFDRSGIDLTAHALRAISAWKDNLLSSAGISWEEFRS